MTNRIEEIEKEIAKLQEIKRQLEIEKNRKHPDNDIDGFLHTYSGSKLLEKYSLDTEGVWEVRGEDPNCDLGGHHSQPFLGRFEGTLEKVIKKAITLEGWNIWGTGGTITKVTKDNLITKL
jgi:hypothetical protein